MDDPAILAISRRNRTHGERSHIETESSDRAIAAVAAVAVILQNEQDLSDKIRSATGGGLLGWQRGAQQEKRGDGRDCRSHPIP